MNLKQFLLIVFVLNITKINANDVENYTNNCKSSLVDDSIDISILGSDIYGVPDPRAGEQLAKWNFSNKSNAEEQGTYVEGDILFHMPHGRNVIRDTTKRWKSGIVPYIIDGTFNADQLAIVMSAISQFHTKTPIRFVSRTNQVDYLAITSTNSGCYSAIGKVGGRQEINLQVPGCLSQVGTVIHLCMHTLGFFHEHTRWERDNYITVQYDNIISGQSVKFDKKSRLITNDYKVKYDYGSIMHYSAFAYSSNGKSTIIPKDRFIHEAVKMGQRTELSERDILKINRMYGSDGITGGTISIPVAVSSIISDLVACATDRYQKLLLLTATSTQNSGGFETNDKICFLKKKI